MRMIVVVLTWFGLASAAFAEPVLGVWQTERGEEGNFAHVQMTRCGNAICGTLIRGYNSAGQAVNSPLVGRQMIADMRPAGDGEYRGGTIWAPDQDRTYNARMSLSGDRLQVSGCVLGGVICRSQNWQRVR